ncbi:MAG: FMN-binding glutamate synthase family protein [gamma proteobacterium symbiont of Ctena orbiculata]|uniref:FMN-binding glutamate synthase family protein n=1 Tax=Candidatus Thiodiazotropha taylori TaxID=2792791 RepID=A0A944M991_9GAMM|nr:FMN-binding glutamate synthase family protein [Candidatus Thiodiazotropha taylori]PUB87264.1 MAG: FMN-binding glutamate synthase family protein [gamma proteobacterium symbiont of Ctena orbiculata]MBT2989152.1 FMN-binding glutamate synthase family protein [Candidatus Thiodiazotropha taylori]MBT2995637.1 FMN-binding glutamate synthase family protein [Candidatus Thiodiazotropha taylori]MBT2999409.1 FMN-binding glutamate synthase family protein [Candidatus Thiodiazotropha taylori]
MTAVTESWVFTLFEILSVLFVFILGMGVLALIVLYIIDVTQTQQTIRRNYPVIGRFRYFFEHMGEFFRQYFFAMDREEMPFNRAERSWAYRAAKNENNTIAFGSTRDLRPTGTIFFVNCPYPTLGEDAVPATEVIIGPDCDSPYTTDSLINISGMSFGALSVPAVRALSAGAHKAGCWMNTGEGGLSPYHLEGGADLVFQIGTAKFGVRDRDGNLSDERIREIAAHDTVRMFEIKLSQGAKPGKGGILPGAKVTPEIAEIRGIEVGRDAISPNRHPDINSADELLNMIERIRRVSGKPVGFKTVIGAYGWLEGLFETINDRGPEYAPDFITVDGADGGTGAAPMALMDYVGLPLNESLPMVVDMLCEYGLRERVKVVCSGKLITPAGVAWALAVGADFVASARGFMFALGCIQALQCNKNTCPTGITTHDPKLQRGLVSSDKAQRVANYVNNMNYEVGLLAHSCGVREPRELKRFHARMVMENGKSVPLDVLYPPKSTAST